MSFCMIGAFAAYATMYFLTSKGYMEVPLILIFAMSILIGVILQLFNWVLIDRLKMKSFIATLGTQTFLKGAVLAFVSSSYIYTLPNSAVNLVLHIWLQQNMEAELKASCQVRFY